MQTRFLSLYSVLCGPHAPHPSTDREEQCTVKCLKFDGHYIRRLSFIISQSKLAVFTINYDWIEEILNSDIFCPKIGSGHLLSFGNSVFNRIKFLRNKYDYFRMVQINNANPKDIPMIPWSDQVLLWCSRKLWSNGPLCLFKTLIFCFRTL